MIICFLFSYLYFSIATMAIHSHVINKRELQASEVGLDEHLIRRLYRLFWPRVESMEQMAMASSSSQGDLWLPV